ncbi:hypothetical protein GCM10010185_67800 [Saccharothrix coeruleofusca]|uniref:non-specific serine/threonine protein kinase n=2 Tax=Saccharothrix coeruleofusca TaxID=33919 RepID=A0A918AT54_9PSEU|nr:hypothetical protein GCM10010185_67800 [Saccharothrix coeruleofusca]
MWDGELTGQVVGGRYALGELYGSGGMADVYRARDTRLDRPVAVKVFQGVATSGEEVRLDREARVLAALRCPGLVAVYDSGVFRGHPYFVMQAVEGGTLRARMHEALSPESVANLGVQIARVLAHVHERGVVHRDVKPSNVLLDVDERRAYLTDFGLALQPQLTRVTRSGMMVGTAGYLAPEQVRGAEVTPAVDVYALGLMLLECLTGRPEYPGGDTEAALARLHRPPRIPAGLPEPWGEALAAMTDSDPARRPTAAECAELLRSAQLASGQAPPLDEVLTAEVEPAAANEAPPSRRPVGALVAGALAAVAVTSAVVLNLDGPPPAQQRSEGTATTSEQPAARTTAPPPQPAPSTVTVVQQIPVPAQPQPRPNPDPQPDQQVDHEPEQQVRERLEAAKSEGKSKATPPGKARKESDGDR